MWKTSVRSCLQGRGGRGTPIPDSWLGVGSGNYSDMGVGEKCLDCGEKKNWFFSSKITSHNLKGSVKTIQRQRQTKFLQRPNLENLRGMEMDYFNSSQNLQVQKCIDFFWIWRTWGGAYNWNWADLDELLLEYLISQNLCKVNTIYFAHISLKGTTQIRCKENLFRKTSCLLEVLN